jgi:hypothetical protein
MLLILHPSPMVLTPHRAAHPPAATTRAAGSNWRNSGSPSDSAISTSGDRSSTGSPGKTVLDPMTRQDQRAYVRRWVETGQLLEQIRWRELRALEPAAALAASDDLIEAALRVPLSAARRDCPASSIYRICCAAFVPSERALCCSRLVGRRPRGRDLHRAVDGSLSYPRG